MRGSRIAVLGTGLALLPLLALAPPAAAGFSPCIGAAGLAWCSYSGSTYQEESVTFDDPALASAGVRYVHFEGFFGPDTTYEAWAGTTEGSPLGANGAAFRYRCMQLNGGPSCNVLYLTAGATAAGLGGPSVTAGHERDFANPGATCVAVDGANVVCRAGSLPLPPLPHL